jgi:tetratricopeptide (TPR) repeat protein
MPCAIPQADQLIEKAYANMSACHIKRENWKRAQETAEKALAKNPKNYKAMFRRGKALGELGYFERAEKILEELIKESPAGELAAWAGTLLMSSKSDPSRDAQTRRLPPLNSRDCVSSTRSGKG